MSRPRWPAAAALLVALAATSNALASSPSAELLERHRPLLVFDSAERYSPQRVAKHGQVLPGDRVYGHVSREGGTTWLQYWLFYAYNAQDRGILKTGRHQGDWELVQLRLDPQGEPDLATLTQHSWAEGCSWNELERRRSGRLEVPVIYVANGSHANYSAPGTHDRPWPDPNNEADGNGPALRPPVEVITENHPRWVNDEAPWGESRPSFVPGEQSSPVGPKFQPDERWSHPSTFHDQVARSCGSNPPGRPWQSALMLILGLVVSALIALALRRTLGSGQHHPGPGLGT